MTSGVYTTHIIGANQTPNSSQFQIASRVSSGLNTNHPAARNMYAEYARRRVPCLHDEELMRGTARTTANEAASEKLTTDIIEMTVDARHRFMDFKTIQRGATDFDRFGGILSATKGIR